MFARININFFFIFCTNHIRTMSVVKLYNLWKCYTYVVKCNIFFYTIKKVKRLRAHQMKLDNDKNNNDGCSWNGERIRDKNTEHGIRTFWCPRNTVIGRIYSIYTMYFPHNVAFLLNIYIYIREAENFSSNGFKCNVQFIQINTIYWLVGQGITVNHWNSQHCL